MDIIQINQKGRNIYSDNITWDSGTGEIVVPAGTYKFFDLVITLTENRFTLAAYDKIFITDTGLIQLYQKPEPSDPDAPNIPDSGSIQDHDFTQYACHNLFGFERSGTFYYIIFI